MRAFLEVLTGPQACRRAALAPGEPLRVGRTDDAHVTLPHDKKMSGLHFALEFDGAACRVRDLGSHTGTLLEGIAVGLGPVHDGDTIIAGDTWFRVRIRPPWGATPRDGDRRLPEPVVRGVTGALAAEPAPLFAILDAARDERVLALLGESDVAYQSLYEGHQGQLLLEQAPYLVELGGASSFVEALVRRGWGDSWGVYLTSGEPFREVRRHLRRFLFVRDEGGREMYFRFYDPRVLRVFLPTATPRQTGELFEGALAFLMEGPAPAELYRFTGEERSPRLETRTFDGGS